MKDNILKELDDPQDQRRNMDIVTPNFFEWNQTTKCICYRSNFYSGYFF